MGEVYAAEDTRLSRKVAIKTLPHGLAGDSERLRRFTQVKVSAKVAPLYCTAWSRPFRKNSFYA